tara:strand:+ start:1783 stop:2076 length:294 start_codon:yes stop_codon:yes gene_type:complete
LKKINILKRKLNKVEKLAKKALMDTPDWKPSPGYEYIKNIRVGELVETSSGTKAVLTAVSDVSVNVLVTSVMNIEPEDKPYYLGNQRWSSNTEVKIV